jgi:hypothetical protein
LQAGFLSEQNAIEPAHEILKMKHRPGGLLVTNNFEANVYMQELKRFFFCNAWQYKKIARCWDDNSFVIEHSGYRMFGNKK